MNDFLDNLGNNQHQKMLREIANDGITPKKTDHKVNNDLYETDELEYDDELYKSWLNNKIIRVFYNASRKSQSRF